MRLLVIEDDIDQAAALAACLRAANFAVNTASDAKRGQALLQNNCYDLLILDYSLPDKDGLSVCRELRADGYILPILILSIRSEISDKTELLNNGADDYMSKPCATEELLARIAALLRRPPPAVHQSIFLSGVEIDLSQRVARFQSRDLPLTRHEFGLLELLGRQQGMTLSRDMILDHVWETGTDIFSKTIETHIHTLRRKLATAGCPRLIRTVSGLGYVIDRTTS